MQVSLGLGYKINESLRLDAGIKHFHMKDTNITNKCLSPKIKYRTNEGFLGLKYFI
jgi:long-subunit fatty acid transport protein